METLEGLKAIRDNAPEGKTMTCKNGYYWNDNDLSDLAFTGDSIRGVTRSLSDIERIIELEEKLNSFAYEVASCECMSEVSKTLRGYGYD